MERKDFEDLADYIRASIGRRPNYVVVKPDNLVLLLNAASEANDRLVSKHRKATMRVAELTKAVDALQAERDEWKAKNMGTREAHLEAQCSVLVARVRGMQRKLAKQGQTIARHGADVQRMAWLETELDKARTERDQLRQRVDNCLRLSDQHQERIADLEQVRDAYKSAAEAFKDTSAQQQVDVDEMHRIATLEGKLAEVRAERDLLKPRLDNCHRLEAEQLARIAEREAQCAGLVEKVSDMQRKLVKANSEHENCRAALIEWQEKTVWVQRTCTGRDLGKHRADVLRERIEALQRSRDELSKRLADEQRLHIKVDGLQGAGTETLQRCLNAFRANRGTPVRMAGDDAIRVFQLAIQALDRPGELGEIVDHLRRHAAAVQSTSERLTNLFDRKTEG